MNILIYDTIKIDIKKLKFRERGMNKINGKLNIYIFFLKQIKSKY